MPSITDDSGIRVPLLSSKELARVAAREDLPRMAAVARRLRRALKAETRRSTPDRLAIGLIIGVACFVVWIVGIWIASAVFGGAVVLGTTLLLLIAASIGGSILMQAYAQSISARNLAATAVAEGVCGSCAFSLEGASPDPRGMLTCPECGAVWHIERITRAHWLAPVMLPHPRRWWYNLVPGVQKELALWAPDSRGCYVPVYDSRLFTLEAQAKASIGEDAVRRLRRTVRSQRAGWRYLIVVGGLGVGLLFGLGAMRTWHPRYWGESAVLWTLGGVCVIAALLVAGSAAFISARATVRAFLTHLLCPACATPFGDAAPATSNSDPQSGMMASRPTDSTPTLPTDPASAPPAAPPTVPPTATPAAFTICSRCRAAWHFHRR